MSEYERDDPDAYCWNYGQRGPSMVPCRLQAGEQKDFPVPPDDPDIRRRAEELYIAWTLVEDAEHRAKPALTFADLVAFLSDYNSLTHEQQRFLFSDPRLKEDFRCLKQDFAVRLRPEAGTGDTGARVLGMPAQKAAASEEGPEVRRRLEGGELHIAPVGID